MAKKSNDKTVSSPVRLASTPTSIRLSERTKTALSEIAIKERRSLNNVISMILDDYVNEHYYSDKDTPSK